MFQNLSEIQKTGFTGFKTISELSMNHTIIPDERGVYLVIPPPHSQKSFYYKVQEDFSKIKIQMFH